MVAAIGFSALMALSLTPALCATLLKPVEAGHHHHASAVCSAGSIAASEAPHATAIGRMVERLVARPAGRFMLIYVAHAGRVGWAFVRLPGGFLPVDDQGFITIDVQTPPEASFNRTLEAIKSVEDYLLQRPGVETSHRSSPASASSARASTPRRPSSRSSTGRSAVRTTPPNAIVADVNDEARPRSATRKISALQPPPIDNLGNSRASASACRIAARRATPS